MIETIGDLIASFSSLVWGLPLVGLILGGGIFFTVYSRFAPLRHLFHTLDVLRGKYSSPDDPGQITHFQALCTALASTIGLGNISGVAIAIYQGGPGALFWMWLCAALGMSTKFFTCTLSVLYRGRDSAGELQGGPMYFIQEGLGPKFKPLAVFFAVCGLLGCLSLFQTNQLMEIFLSQPALAEWSYDGKLVFRWVGGILVASLVGMVIFGGIQRIGKVASKLTPTMALTYVGLCLVILIMNIQQVPAAFLSIFEQAFKPDAAFGGALGAVILVGVRRGAFSNEAGIGTEALAHGAAKTKEPIREGLVAMLGPLIDTLVICTMTGLVILVTGVASEANQGGVAMTSKAFETALPGVGAGALLICVLFFSVSTMIGYSYYGAKCSGFLFGAGSKNRYNAFYLFMLVVGAVASSSMVVNFVDGMFALMAIPTMFGTLALAPRVMKEARAYFDKI